MGAKFDQEKFDQFILENGIIGFFKDPLKLKSGRFSHWYVNWRTVAEDAYLLDQLTDFVIAFIKSKKLNPDTFYGVPEGASKLGVLTQYKWAKSQKKFARGSHVLAMGRGKAKDHGAPKDKHFLAMPKGDTIVLEDVTSTGMSLFATLDTLQNLHIPILAGLALTNRNQVDDAGKSVEQLMKERGLPYFAISNALTLLPKLCAAKKATPGICASIEKEFAKYGTEPIKL